MEEGIGKARLLLRRRGHRLQRDNKKKKKKSVGTRITDFSWRLQRPLKSPPAHFRKRKAIINIKKANNKYRAAAAAVRLLNLLNS